MRWTAMGLALTGLLLATGPAAAQTGTTPATDPGQTTAAPAQPGPAPTSPGTFDQLSPGNQKIARALYEAQQQPQSPSGGATTPSATGGTASKSLTLDDIAAMKQSGRGWGEIFKDLRQQGLVQDKNLGQVVSRYNHRHRTGSSSTTITTGSGRTYTTGGRGPSQHGAGYKGADGRGSQSGPSASSGHGNAYGRSGGPSGGGGHGKAGQGGGSAGHGGRGK